MRDPGLAVERPALAWNRTALGLLGVGALLLRFTRIASVPVIGEVVAVGTLLAAGLVWRYGRQSCGVAPRAATPLRALAIAVTVLACGATAAVTIGLA